MTDGTTGFQVAPTAEEANMFAATLRKMADAVVQASTLPKQVEDLRAKVSNLQSALSHAQLHASKLDTTLHEVRQERDQARSDIRDMQRTIDNDTSEISSLRSTVDRQEVDIQALREQLANAYKERDDAQLEAMQAQDELDKARKALADIQAQVAAFFPKQPEPEPPAAMLNPTVHTEPVEVEQQPAQSSSPAEQSEPETRDDWAPGYDWDYKTQCYRRKANTSPDPAPDGTKIPF